MRITHQGKTQVLHYAKTTTCRLGDDGKSIVMEDREVSPWTGKPLVVSSVIRYDANTEKYKAMVWDTDGEVRLFVLNVDDSKIVFEQVDCDQSTTFSSTVTMKEESLEEQGSVVRTGEHAYTVEWKIRYTRSDTTRN